MSGTLSMTCSRRWKKWLRGKKEAIIGTARHFHAMLPESQLLGEKDTILTLVSEKRSIEAKLVAAGGEKYQRLLELCSDLADIIDDIGEIAGKRAKIEHAAFATKVKFSRKVRRKAKDLGNFEKELIAAYDQKLLPLEMGRKMVDVAKKLRSADVENARRQAEEFMELVRLQDRKGEIEAALGKKAEQVKRAKVRLASLLSDLEWVEKQAPVDEEKVKRHELAEKLMLELKLEREAQAKVLESLPLAELLERVKRGKLGEMGFPHLPDAQMDSLAAYLKKSSLATKAAWQLLELVNSSEQKLKYMGIGLADFKREIIANSAFIFQITLLHTSDFLKFESVESPAVGYLALQSQLAKKAAEELVVLRQTAQEDGLEWQRSNLIGEKKAGLAGANKEELLKAQAGLLEIEAILESKVEVAKKAEKGLLEALKGFFS